MLFSAICAIQEAAGRGRSLCVRLLKRNLSCKGVVGRFVSFMGSGTAKGRTALIFAPTVLVMVYTTGSTHNDLILRQKYALTIGTGLSSVIIHYTVSPFCGEL